jgi:hypothetical protein
VDSGVPEASTAHEVKPVRTSPESRVLGPAAVVASCGGFVLVGALQALYGPAIPAFRDAFALSPSAAGLGLSAHFVGGVAGVLVFDRLYGRLGNRPLLGSSYLLTRPRCGGLRARPDLARRARRRPARRTRLRRHRPRPQPALRRRLRPPLHTIEWSGVRAVPIPLGVVSALCPPATPWLIHATRPPSPVPSSSPVRSPSP